MKFANVINDTQLEIVTGGNLIDRSMIIDNLKSRGLDEYLVKNSDGDINLKATCKKYGIGYDENTFGCDEFFINGHWRSSWWIKDHVTETVDFIKAKIGIK